MIEKREGAMDFFQNLQFTGINFSGLSVWGDICFYLAYKDTFKRYLKRTS